MNNNQENTMKRLEDFKKEPGFTVPDGYYDDLYEKMMGRIATEHHKTKNHKRLFRYSFIGSAAAAAIALFVTINIINQNGTTPTIAEITPQNSQIKPNQAEVNQSEVAQINETQEKQINMNSQEASNGSSKSPKRTTSAYTNTENNTNTDELMYSVLEFYEDDARSDQFQETLMDLECYYEF